MQELTQGLDDFKALTSLYNSDLDKVDAIIKNSLDLDSELIPILTEYLLEAGGKRLRPLLSIICAKLYGYKGNQHYQLASIIELIHTATLLHDDVIDESKLRRGKATANQNWGNKASILVGDYLFSQAFRLMVEIGDLEILALLSKASNLIAKGEVIQLEESSNLTLNLSRYYQIIDAKTAILFASSCQIGAMLAKASPAEMQALYNYGQNLGMAFQIIDDSLDYFATEQDLGKNLGDDFKAGKVTLPLILFIQNLNKLEFDNLAQILIKTNISEAELANYIAKMRAANIHNLCWNIASNYLTEARKYLTNLPTNFYTMSLNKILDFTLAKLPVISILIKNWDEERTA